MSTIAAALQIPTAAPTREAAPGEAPPGVASELAGDEFVLALTQALSTVALPAAAAQVASVVVSGAALTAASAAEEPSTEELAAAFAGMLSLPLLAANSVPAPSASVDPLQMLGVTDSASRAGSPVQPLLQALQAAVSNPLPSTPTGAPSLEGALTEAAPQITAQPENDLLLAPGIERPSQPAPAADAPASARPLQHSVGTQAWNEELGTRVSVMAERGQHSASLRLSPEHLGPLEIRIAIRDDQASVWFGAAHADTRAAIEHALPRLREMFAAQGMSLTDAGVSREPPRDQPPAPTRQSSVFGDAANETPLTSTHAVRSALIDAYA